MFCIAFDQKKRRMKWAREQSCDLALRETKQGSVFGLDMKWGGPSSADPSTLNSKLHEAYTLFNLIFMWIHYRYGEDDNLSPFCKWGLKLTEIKWLGKGTLLRGGRVGTSSAKFSTLPYFVVPVAVKNRAWDQGGIIDTESKHTKKHSYISSYWLAIHMHAGGYVVLSQVATIHGPRALEPNPTEKLVKWGDSGTAGIVSEQRSPRVFCLPFLVYYLFSDWQGFFPIFAFCKHSSLTMWLKK